MHSLPTTPTQSEHVQQHTHTRAHTSGPFYFRGGAFTLTAASKPPRMLWSTALWSPTDTREDFYQLVYWTEMSVHSAVHSLTRVLKDCHKPTTPQPQVIYWFHVPNIDSYRFYITYLFILISCSWFHDVILLSAASPLCCVLLCHC